MSKAPLPVKRALVSVSDKNGLIPFCAALVSQGVDIVSSGGTARTLTEAGIAVTPVSKVTGFPEILDGRVKTLNPRIHGGILARKDVPSHLAQLSEHGILAFDLVVVNLYPFSRTVEKEGVTLDEALEMIDVGGPAMVRAAAKNYPSVAVVCNPARYKTILEELANRGGITFTTRLELAHEAFASTCLYDAAIVGYLDSQRAEGIPPGTVSLPERLILGGEKIQDLRYGENPHQRAAFYAGQPSTEPLLARARQLGGKDLSYNNILDADASLALVIEFDRPACVIVKHTNPCGVALADNLAEAHRKAMLTDPVSAFGGIVAFNRTVDAAAAAEVAKVFTEVLIAPSYEPNALKALQEKKNLRILELPGIDRARVDCSLLSVRSVSGGYLVQNRDTVPLKEGDLKTVTRRSPTSEEMSGLRFAWKVAKHVKSNAIVYAREGQLVAVGAGQMSRVDSAKIGIMKANLPVAGTVLASDAFFPFRDGIDAAAAAGVTAIIQPGGSVRDDQTIVAADEHGIAMVFTGMRHFRH